MLFAMFALVLLTFVIAAFALKARFASVKLRQVGIGYFRLMQAEVSKPVPERVIVTTRCYNNMFEVPVLFYTAGTASLALDQVTTFSLVLAWAFVLSRCVHAWIHLTYNNVLHRMNAFWVGKVLVLALWIEQALQAL